MTQVLESFDRRAISMTELASVVDEVIDDGFDDLLEAVRIPSVVAWGEANMKRSAVYFRDLLREDGWRAEARRVLTNWVVFAEVGTSAEASKGAAVPTILLYGHHDVQPPEPLEHWTSPPFEPIVRDGFLFGRGAADAKGQLFCHIFGMRALRRLAGEALPIHIKLLLDGEEEAGNPSLDATLKTLGPRLSADFVFTVDGPVDASGRPRITFGFRGVMTLKLTVRTASSSLHSGHWGNFVPDAALTLAHVLSQIRSPDGRVRVPGFYDRVRKPNAVERAAIAAVPFNLAESVSLVGASRAVGANEDALERMMFEPTLTVTGLASGYAGAGFQASIPGLAVAHLEIRYVPDQRPDEIFAALEKFITSLTPDASLEGGPGMPPSRTPMNTPAAPLVARAVEIGFGVKPIMLPSSGGSSPESLFTEGLGLPSLWAHFANIDMRNHGPDENLSIDNLRAGTRATTALLLMSPALQTSSTGNGETTR